MWFQQNGKSEQFSEAVCPRQRLFQYKRHSIGNVRWSMTSVSCFTAPSVETDIFAASGESTAWVLLWKTRSRPIGVRVCFVVQFISDVSSSWVHQRTKEKMRPIFHLRQPYPSLMILMFFLDHKVHHFLKLLVRRAYHQDGLQLHHLMAIEKEWARKHIAWAVTFATFTTWASTFSKSCEWLRWWSATTRRETLGTV